MEEKIMKKICDVIIGIVCILIVLYGLLVSAGLLPESLNILNLNPYLW